MPVRMEASADTRLTPSSRPPDIGLPADGESTARWRTLRQGLSAHRGARLYRSLYELAVTLALFALGWWCMWLCLPYGYWASLLVGVPTAGMLVRLFILQHDCGHGALFASPAANRLTGVLLSALTLTPYQCWRRQHAQHHATNGQLDHRGVGDVTMHTVAEYAELSAWQRWQYRVYRHPLILFGIGPILYFGLLQRLPWRVPAHWRDERLSIHGTNVLLAIVFVSGAWALGTTTFLLLHLPVLTLAASAGSWLFFVQHQFNPTYWQRDEGWDHFQAAIDGSSYLDLPWPLRWITANIGYHHIHHLDSRIPYYALPSCHETHPELRRAPRLTLWEGLRCSRLKLWDEDARELITFRQAKSALRNLQLHRGKTTKC